GNLSATVGDFDGDGQEDLAVGETSTTLSNASGDQLNKQTAGHVWVISSAGQQISESARANQPLDLSDPRVADVVFTGQNPGDGLGTLPLTPDMDLDGDGSDDLLVGAAGAATDTAVGGFDLSGGKVYVLYGAPTVHPLPPAGS